MRILSTVLAVATVGLVIAGSVTFLVQRERILDEVTGRLTAQVASLVTIADTAPAADAEASTEPGEAAASSEQLRVEEFSSVADYLSTAVARLVPSRNEASVAVIDGVARFRPTTLSGFDVSENSAFIDRVVAETSAAEGTVMGTAVTDEGTLQYIAIPVLMEDDPDSGLYIRAVDLDKELSSVSASMLTYTLAAIATLAAIGIIGWFVVGRLLSPIRYLRETADSITLSDLRARIPEQGNDDLSDLTRTVNSMLDRLEGSVDVQRQLLDDVRHELKTPITIVRGHLEMMNPRDPDDIESSREIGIAELDRMTRLVEDIDMLATVAGEQYTMATVHLGSLTARCGELVTVIPGHSWVIADSADGDVVGDADRLLQAWLQLADNAAKYTPHGSSIEIGSSRSTTGEVMLWVRDHGEGIPAALRHRIFQRFNRANERRTVGGSGLGLAIVDAITKAHGGHCTVDDAPGGGALFIIHLPGRPAEADLPAPVRAGDVVLQREASE